MASQTFYIRSISLPSKSQQEAIRIEEEIKTLKSIVASSSCVTTKELKNSLREIGNIYESVKAILQLPSNQGIIFSTLNKKWMEKELDESIKVLDLCTNIRGYLVLVKDHAQELSLALRRKDKSRESRLEAYVCSLKKAKKDTNNCYKSLKKDQSKDSDLHIVIRILIELREITTSLLRSVFSSFSMPSKSQPDALRIEEDIKALKASVASSSTVTPEKLNNSLKEISKIYESIEMFLQLPSNQQTLCNGQNRKWMEKELDQSIKLLDICSNIRDYLVLVKDHARELSLAFRRKDKLLENGLNAYACSLKKAQKEIKKSFKSLKKSQDKYSDLYMIVMSIELREVSASLLQSIFSFFSMPKTEVKGLVSLEMVQN